MESNFGTVNHLLPPSYKRIVSAWLEEDCPSFDYGGFVVGEEVKEAILLGKSPVRFYRFLRIRFSLPLTLFLNSVLPLGKFYEQRFFCHTFSYSQGRVIYRKIYMLI